MLEFQQDYCQPTVPEPQKSRCCAELCSACFFQGQTQIAWYLIDAVFIPKRYKERAEKKVACTGRKLQRQTHDHFLCGYSFEM